MNCALLLIFGLERRALLTQRQDVLFVTSRVGPVASALAISAFGSHPPGRRLRQRLLSLTSDSPCKRIDVVACRLLAVGPPSRRC